MVDLVGIEPMTSSMPYKSTLMESKIYMGIIGNEKARWEHFDRWKRALNCAPVLAGLTSTDPGGGGSGHRVRLERCISGTRPAGTEEGKDTQSILLGLCWRMWFTADPVAFRSSANSIPVRISRAENHDFTAFGTVRRAWIKRRCMSTAS